MEIIKTDIEGVVIIEPRIFKDARGYFFESYNKREFDERIARIDFVEEHELCKPQNVINGLSFQIPPFDQSKLVRCVKGSILYIAVDIRKGSLTYGQHLSIKLTEDNHRQIYIPRGFAHGFAFLGDCSIIQIKSDNYFKIDAQRGISIFDDGLNID